jgi:hypothetical protein
MFISIAGIAGVPSEASSSRVERRQVVDQLIDRRFLTRATSPFEGRAMAAGPDA